MPARKRVRGLLRRAFGPRKADIVTVPIDRCRHYCAFKYGSGSFNPYENYVVGLHEGAPLGELRQRFEDFLIHYRPRDFGEVFGIALSRRVPLWVYPWQLDLRFDPQNGWLDDLDEVPDIITHFCARGIRRSRIQEEYFWLERAYATVSTHGYRPHKNTFIEALEFAREDERAYLLTDGNHRVSALTALGHEEVMVKVHTLVRWDGENHREWPQVRLGTYSEQDAIKVFDVYFGGVTGFTRSDRPARIIEEA